VYAYPRVEGQPSVRAPTDLPLDRNERVPVLSVRAHGRDEGRQPSRPRHQRHRLDDEPAESLALAIAEHLCCKRGQRCRWNAFLDRSKADGIDPFWEISQ